jgi:hypothetical protein
VRGVKRTVTIAAIAAAAAWLPASTRQPHTNTTAGPRTGPRVERRVARPRRDRRASYHRTATRLGTYDALGVKAGIIAAAAPALVALMADGWPPLRIIGGAAAPAALFKTARRVTPSAPLPAVVAGEGRDSRLATRP